ncbi:unnamed protein product [marine sediment metagenome]|uniref:Uncharacterized protein n=1 Tax=marine sediment metagenome TaxID=412755 RepID=X1HP32_9ZZZZ
MQADLRHHITSLTMFKVVNHILACDELQACMQDTAMIIALNKRDNPDRLKVVSVGETYQFRMVF